MGNLSGESSEIKNTQNQANSSPPQPAEATHIEEYVKESSPGTVINQKDKNQLVPYLIIILITLILAFGGLGLYSLVPKPTQTIPTQSPINVQVTGLISPVVATNASDSARSSPTQLSTATAISCVPTVSVGNKAWKRCAGNGFLISVPADWQANLDNGMALFNSTPNQNNLSVGIEDSATLKPPNLATDLTTNQKTLDTEIATEYHGCIGVEGCQETYMIEVVHNKRLITITFLPYSLSKDVYQSIISTFKFTD